MISAAAPLCTVAGVHVWQDPAPGTRIHFTADLSVDVDGTRKSYRLDNDPKLALDDIHASAGWPHNDWWNVLVRDPQNPSQPLVDINGYCVSKTAYERAHEAPESRKRYLDAAVVPYLVAPGLVRRLCRGVMVGCKARLSDVVTGKSIEGVCGDISGGNIGEASLAAARFFEPRLTARNGDERSRYLYEFWPGTPAVIGAETFELIRA